MDVFSTGKPVVWGWEKNPYTFYQIYKYPFMSAEGEELILEMGIDISEQKRTERELAESEERYRRLIEGSPDIIYSFSKDGNDFYVSDRVSGILGYSAQQLMENPSLWHDSIHPEDKDAVFNAVGNVSEADILELEYRIRDVEGVWHWFLDRTIGVHSNQTRIID